MNVFQQLQSFFNIPLGDFLGVALTSGKLVGYVGGALFTGRWLFQMAASSTSGKPVLPQIFWYMRMVGSLCLLSYFVFGKNDSVGILSNLFPLTVALYNLSLDFKSRKKTIQ
jgi:lipid-A-disaccharide synthase-like uncharacterized protein